MSLMPDPTFYPSPGMAMQAAPERIAYVALLNVAKNGKQDAIGVINVDPSSSAYGQFVGQVDLPNNDNELHHFGWNACSACLCPQAPHPHMERRYLVVPGIGSSRIHILDTKPDPNHPTIVKVIEPEEFIKKTGYTSPHTIHCGPDGIYGSALGSASGDGPGGIFLMDANTFELKGPWEKDHGPQSLAYDFWWHLGHDTMITSEWGTPNMVKDGLNAELLLGGKYGHKLHVWDLDKRRHLQEIDLGAEQQMVLELRPSHDPKKTFGFVGVVVSLKDLSASIWMWYREDGGKNGKWAVRKVIEIPAEPADPESLPPLLKGFKAVPPLVSDINLSLDDRFLYVSCWGTGEFIQYDVSDPANPKKTGSIHVGGIVRRAAHPKKPKEALNGGPQMVEISRDGKRVYFTNSLYSPWDEQFYPDGVKSWMVKIDANPRGGMKLDEKFFVEFDGLRAHQLRLEGGDASSVLLLGPTMTHAGLNSTALWLMLLLGAYHGLNPGMGWLFAVALGMQEQKGSAVARSLVPIALGHALAIGSVVLAAAFLGMTLPLASIHYFVAAVLVGLGIYCLVRHQHPRWVRMQVGFRDLTVWSFLMASAHGAGLMVVPVLLGSNAVEAQGHMTGHNHPSSSGTSAASPLAGMLATGVHTISYLAVTGLIAWVVYRKFGLALLRKAWFNFDLVWAAALVATGLVTLLL